MKKNSSVNLLQEVFIKIYFNASHLGHYLTAKNAYTYVTDKFVRYALVNVKCELFETFCVPLYGILFWNLGSKNGAKFYLTWGERIRKQDTLRESKTLDSI